MPIWERSQGQSDQNEALECLVEKDRRGSDQLICFLHGPGGSGKTTVMDLLMEYSREYCSYMHNFNFTSRTIVVTAMSGVAATLLLGETTHSALYLNAKTGIKSEYVSAWEDTRMVIIDEISFASRSDFSKFHQHMRRLKQQLHLPYGGLSIIFSGDMRQLEPVAQGVNPVYQDDCPEFKDWVNCFIELDGMHRFKDDPEWGHILLRFRNGEATEDDIDKINESVVDENTILPDDIKYGTYFNRDRDAINTGLFEERCSRMHRETGNTSDSIMIFSDKIMVQDGSKKYVPFKNCMTFWESCGESDVFTSRQEGRMDPVLKLYRSCRVMLPCNTDVSNGQANGTQTTLEQVILKPNESPQTVMIGGDTPVNAVRASQVDHIVVRHCNDRIHPDTFSLRPKEYKYFTAKVPKPQALQVKGQERERLRMKATQIPVIVNNATTGHKLQGSGVDNVFVHNWHYVTNWPYVMLSRVKTRQGLYCRHPLSKDLKKYAVPPALQRMMENFEGRSPTYWNEEEYDELFNIE